MYWIMHNYVHLVDCLFQLVQNAQMLKTNWKLISLSSCKAEVLSKINIHNWALIAWGAETTFRSVFLGMNLSSSAPPSRIVLKIQMCTNLTLPQPEPSVLLASSVALVYTLSPPELRLVSELRKWWLIFVLESNADIEPDTC